MRDSLRFVEIERLSDDLLLPWLDLYETAFPPAERVLVSTLLEIVREREARGAADDHLVAVTDESDTFAGLMLYQHRRDLHLSLLCYMAVMPSLRGRGLGSRMYQELLARARLEQSEVLFLETERPDQAESGAQRTAAERRIEFYRRLGARMLEGIHYQQTVGWHQPPLPMYLMAHPLTPLDDLQVFRMAHSFLGSRLLQIGPLSLG